VLGAAFLAAAVVGGIYLKRELDNQYTLQVSLSGPQEVVVECGADYAETGVSATFFGTHRNTEETAVPVTVAGGVDIHTVGTYYLKYVASYNGVVGTNYRLVHVIDTQPPTITLVSDPEKYTLPNATYVEEGFTAIDAHDGDVTDRVQITQTREKVIYTATDLSGNMATTERTIFYDDPVPPELKLKGGEIITLYVDQPYNEPGYTATDNCSGDLTDNVTVTGSVNTEIEGSYTLTYTVQDAYANETSVTRTVNVKTELADPNQLLNTATPTGKVIYLTFDDGPGPRTQELLNIFKKYGVKATFFVVKNGYKGTIQRIVQEGHSIGVHTATHKFKEVYASEEAYFADLNAVREHVLQLTGVNTQLLRFPGGSSNTVSCFNPGIMTRLTQRVKELDFRYFDWNVDSRDTGGAKTASEVFYNVISGVSGREVSVVLQHDIKGFSIDAVEQIIVWGLENGYTFLPLDTTSPVCEHKVSN
jgi:peptidoglycan/xylan/chitin deacetylase (PgdA/CDA1 family)